MSVFLAPGDEVRVAAASSAAQGSCSYPGFKENTTAALWRFSLRQTRSTRSSVESLHVQHPFLRLGCLSRSLFSTFKRI